jgi:nucleoside-diphosphate-sugar epimerase
MALTVAVTGPTGEIGTSVIRALEQEDRVDRVLGMARRPFDPASRGWRQTQYRQVHTARHPMLMDTTKARRKLGWTPAHTAHETLTAMVDAERDRAAW